MMPVLIVLNAGSSSLKFQVYDTPDGADPRVAFKGLFEGLGASARFVVKDARGQLLDEMTWSSGDRLGHEEALMHLVSWLRQHQEGRRLAAIGHRVVHGGGSFSGPVLVDDAVIETLETLVPLAPLHQPHNLEPIRIVRRRLPGLPQVASFDTAFHQTQSEIARTFALPREMSERGVRRYGFHGLSYDYISSVLKDYDPRLAEGRVIVAHLGNGASLCALHKGASIATTMGFSALEGLPMGTRCGALDPGVVFFMLREMKLTPDEAERMLYTKSGLLGVSGLSNDMRVLRANAANNADARRAIDLFVYRITREIGSLVAALGGLDGLVFTGGIGENDVATRSEVIAGLAWAGFSLNEAANGTGGPRISAGSGPAAWVIPTNEELVIARQTRSVLGTAHAKLAS
ncbi:acetate/propionate family kinase [Microvirga mediterraneensis]|uniref:Acetate kinase n=1 Tax=Microvirga mediterraneensis TaxID=2754695 RepID=A0A838BP53_9HYPH|nr:acetate/propionate family kinase [Microvirga mediterraneensis]MBA1156815.1 acetate/propionate family kinase [Microvirga mediterraneensis]